jgi:integrase
MKLDSVIPSKFLCIIEELSNHENANSIKSYLIVRKTIDDVSESTLRTDFQALRTLAEFLQETNFDDVTQDEMLVWKSQLLDKDSKFSKRTANLYMAKIKRFYKFISEPQKYRQGKQIQKTISYPEAVACWSINMHGKEMPLDKILSEEQLLKILSVCENYRDQAMIVTLFDGGFRLSELLSLRIENVNFDKLGVYFLLPKDGENLKTGTRKVRLFLLESSSKYIREFLNHHPFKNYPKAPLFYSRASIKLNRLLKKDSLTETDLQSLRLTKIGVQQLISRLTKQAGLSGITPHTFRHNSATRAAKIGLNEMELRIQYGWSRTSHMPSKYVHLASKDMDDKIKVLTGYKEEKPVESKLKVVTCWNCQEDNVPSNIFCSRCGSKLNPDKKDLKPTANEIGVAMQQGLPKEKLNDVSSESFMALIKKHKSELKKLLEEME